MDSLYGAYVNSTSMTIILLPIKVYFDTQSQAMKMENISHKPRSCVYYIKHMPIL